MVNDIDGLVDLSRLLDALKQGDFQERWEVAKQLEGWGEGCIPPLLQVLTEPELDEEVQWFIVRILGSFPHPEGILALVRLLEQSEDEAVTLAAAQGLARLGPIAIERLAPLLEEPRLQETVLRALVQIQHPDLVPLLLAVAPTVSADLRVLIFEALAPFQHSQIVPLLQTGLTDPNPAVRQTAIASLGRRDSFVPHPMQQLRPHLADPDPGVVAEAARALGRIGTVECALALTQRCCQPETAPSLQQVLIQTLGWIGSEQAVVGLIDIWRGLSQQFPLPNPQMQELLLGLGHAKEPSVRTQVVHWALQQLRSPVLHHQADLRARIMLLLGQVADPTDLSVLIDYLADPDAQVRLHGIAALKQIHPEAAYQALQNRIQDPTRSPELREKLAIALQEWG